MTNRARTRTSKLFTRAIALGPASLLLVAACSQGSTNSEGSSGSGGSGGTGGGSGSGTGTASGTSSGSAAGGAGAGAGSRSGGTTSSSRAASSSGSATGTSGGAGASSGSGATASSCTKADAACVCSNTGCSVGSYYLYDNQWTCGGTTGNTCGPESAYGCLNGDNTVSWVVTSNQPFGTANCPAVLSYPAMQRNFDAQPLLSSFTAISATFEETSPRIGSYEVAWDCWFNNNAIELMIWVDNYKQVPGGTKVGSNVPLGGQSYDIWKGGYILFNATTTFTSGTVDLLQIFKYAVAHGWLPADAKVHQLAFGAEICSTNGQDATWTVNNYSLTAN